MSMKNSKDTIGNRTRDLPVRSAVPQMLRHRVPQVTGTNDKVMEAPNRTAPWLFLGHFKADITQSEVIPAEVTAVEITPDEVTQTKLPVRLKLPRPRYPLD
jgi:hypothetical protein